MGCFSFICQSCGRGVKSSSFDGEEVKLFLLKDGKIIQQMEGEYDSYGRVFKNGTQVSSVKHKLRKSVKWEKVDKKSKEDAWHQVCDLMHDDDNISNGIAAIHSSCYKGILPTVRSQRDPNQGWGDEDDEECLMGNTSGKNKYKKPKPVKGYEVVKALENEQKIEKLKGEIRDLEFSIQFTVYSKEQSNSPEVEKDIKAKKAKLRKNKKELQSLAGENEA
jgi:hypothetical protein